MGTFRGSSRTLAWLERLDIVPSPLLVPLSTAGLGPPPWGVRRLPALPRARAESQLPGLNPTARAGTPPRAPGQQCTSPSGEGGCSGSFYVVSRARPLAAWCGPHASWECSQQLPHLRWPSPHPHPAGRPVLVSVWTSLNLSHAHFLGLLSCSAATCPWAERLPWPLSLRGLFPPPAQSQPHQGRVGTHDPHPCPELLCSAPPTHQPTCCGSLSQPDPPPPAALVLTESTACLRRSRT